MFSCEFCKNIKNNYFSRTPSMAAIEKRKLLMPTCTLFRNGHGMTLLAPIFSVEVRICRYMKPTKFTYAQQITQIMQHVFQGWYIL